MTITVSPHAEKYLRKLPKFDQIAIAQKIRGLSFSVGEEKLSGYSYVYRVRIGDYRIVYKRTSQSVYVILIGHRREIYRMLTQLLK